MNAILRAILACLLLSLGFGAGGNTVSAAEVVVVPLKGKVSQAQFFFLRRALKEAERENARAVILDMDTFGGELAATEEMQKALASVKMRTLTYINPNAGSAGALIAVSTKEIYMAPISAIGASAPVTATGEDLTQTLKDKQVSYASAYFRSVAIQNGHNPDITEAFINKEKSVTIGGQLIHDKGSVLTLSAQDAVRIINGKPVLAAGTASSIPELCKLAKLDGTTREVNPTGFEVLAFWVTTLAPLFLLGGIVGAYIEFKMPGFGLPGIFSIFCFTAFFLGHYLAGLAGWEAPLLFIVGLGLVIGELVVHPGTILPGLAGVAMMGGAVLWAMVDRYPGQPYVPDSSMLTWPLLKLALALGMASIVIYFLAKYLPRSPLFSRIVLATHNPAGTALAGVKSEFTRVPVGAEGIARSILRPSGKAEFNGELHDVITAGQFVDPGTRVRVMAVEGSRVVVEPI